MQSTPLLVQLVPFLAPAGVVLMLWNFRGAIRRRAPFVLVLIAAVFLLPLVSLLFRR